MEFQEFWYAYRQKKESNPLFTKALNKKRANSLCYFLLFGQEYCCIESSNDLVFGPLDLWFSPLDFFDITKFPIQDGNLEVKSKPGDPFKEEEFDKSKINHLVAKFKLKKPKNIRKKKTNFASWCTLDVLLNVLWYWDWWGHNNY